MARKYSRRFYTNSGEELTQADYEAISSIVYKEVVRPLIDRLDAREYVSAFNTNFLVATIEWAIGRNRISEVIGNKGSGKTAMLRSTVLAKATRLEITDGSQEGLMNTFLRDMIKFDKELYEAFEKARKTLEKRMLDLDEDVETFDVDAVALKEAFRKLRREGIRRSREVHVPEPIESIVPEASAVATRSGGIDYLVELLAYASGGREDRRIPLRTRRLGRKVTIIFEADVRHRIAIQPSRLRSIIGNTRRNERVVDRVVQVYMLTLLRDHVPVDISYTDVKPLVFPLWPEVPKDLSYEYVREIVGEFVFDTIEDAFIRHNKYRRKKLVRNAIYHISRLLGGEETEEKLYKAGMFLLALKPIYGMITRVLSQYGLTADDVEFATDFVSFLQHLTSPVMLLSEILKEAGIRDPRWAISEKKVLGSQLQRVRETGRFGFLPRYTARGRDFVVIPLSEMRSTALISMYLWEEFVPQEWKRNEKRIDEAFALLTS